jgi:hypothetical protein
VGTTITIALVGDPAQPGAHIPDAEWERPWDDRAKIELEVSNGEMFGSIVERAFQAFGVTPAHGLPAAHVVDLGLREADRARPKLWDMTVVDDEGRAIWTAHDPRLIPYSQLVAAVEAGAVVGDPQELYVILSEPVGDGLGVDWVTLIHAWQLVDGVAKPLAEIGGAAAFVNTTIRIVRRRLGRGQEAINENVHRWSQRGASPSTFQRLLETREAWSPTDLARLLSCSEGDATAVLELYGYGRRDDDGLRHLAGDDTARVFASIADEALGAEIDVSQEARLTFVERVTYIFKMGKRPPELEPTDGDEAPSWENIERRERVKSRVTASAIAAAGLIVGVVLGRGSMRR